MVYDRRVRTACGACGYRTLRPGVVACVVCAGERIPRSEEWPEVARGGERVLFLDVDGVLNSATTRPDPDRPGFAAWLDPVHLAPLNRVLVATAARIVISSSWRVGRSVDDLRTLLGNFGVTAPVVGMTPVLAQRPRAEEIAAWLEEHPVAAYAIVDDDVVAEEGPLGERFVRTSMLRGLTEEHVPRLVELLRR
jgi:hypothetical protein